MTARTSFPVALLSLALTGCVSTTFVSKKSFDARLAVPVDPESVRMLTEPVGQPFVVLGEIEADITGILTDEAILEKVRERAAREGANAVLHTGQDVLRLWSDDPHRHVQRIKGSRTRVRFLAVRVDPTEER